MSEQKRRPPWIITALTWWTFVGVCLSIVGLWATVPTSGLLWPTEISPHWLGILIGIFVFFVLVGAHSAYANPKAKTVPKELQFARAEMASALRAYAAKRGAPEDQRPE